MKAFEPLLSQVNGEWLAELQSSIERANEFFTKIADEVSIFEQSCFEMRSLLLLLLWVLLILLFLCFFFFLIVLVPLVFLLVL